MKHIPVHILFFLMSGCTTLSDNNVAGGYVEAYKAVKQYIKPQTASDLYSLEQIKNIPYASMLLSIGKGSPGLVILESKNLQKQTWVSADGVFFVINKGRIITVEGLGNNLVEFRSSIETIDSSFNSTHKSYYSYDNPELYNLEVLSKLEYIGLEQLSLFSGPKELHLYKESINNDFIGWNKTNYFWLDEKGFVWKSIQHISPKLPPIEFEVTKKPT